MAANASIGFRVHTGWAILVAIAAEGNTIRILHRCRLELLPPNRERFVYHYAATLPISDAEAVVELVRSAAGEASLTAIRRALEDLDVTSACIPSSSAVVADSLSTVLESHARIHAAEGALYAAAIASACKQLRVPVIAVRERDVWNRAAVGAGMTTSALQATIDDLRKTIGPPWTADHKLATAAALVRA